MRCAMTINADEEFAIPVGSRSPDLLPPADVRWSYFARAAIIANGDCARVRAALPERPAELVCGTEGCIWRAPSRPRVTCTGDVATLESEGSTFTRNCDFVHARCDETSATGCSDRQTHACDASVDNRDRCAGDIKLGCTVSGNISFSDCTRHGGRCADTADQLEAFCEYPIGAECGGEPTCTGDQLSVCVLGHAITVDCPALGFNGCAAGACTPR
jgi:hypothetical protein